MSKGQATSTSRKVGTEERFICLAFRLIGFLTFAIWHYMDLIDILFNFEEIDATSFEEHSVLSPTFYMFSRFFFIFSI